MYKSFFKTIILIAIVASINFAACSNNQAINTAPTPITLAKTTKAKTAVKQPQLTNVQNSL